MANPRLDDVPQSVNEAIQDATIRHMLYVEGLKTRQANEVLRFVDDEIIPDLKAQLNDRLERGLTGTFTQQRLEALISQFEGTTTRFKDINTRIQGDLFETALYEAEFNVDMLNNLTPPGVNFVATSPEVIRQVVFNDPFDGRTLGQWFDRLGESTQERLAAEIRRGVTEGQTGQQIVKRISDARILDATRSQVNAIVRTATQHAVSAARDSVFKANSDIIDKVIWNATLDSRTCPTCGALDGKTFPIDKGRRPPAHVSCRCSVSAVTKSFRQLGIDVDEADRGTRASMNGQVPSDLTYNQWLKKQPVDVQNDALGVTKAKLFRKGGLEVNQFVNRNGNELTLAQLRAKDAKAFEKAGIAQS